MTTSEQLQLLVTDESFRSLWPAEKPSFDAFTTTLARLIGNHLPPVFESLKVVVKRTDTWRIRVDGACLAENKPREFYAELVWLPAPKNFRGTIHAKTPSLEKSSVPAAFVFVPPSGTETGGANRLTRIETAAANDPSAPTHGILMNIDAPEPDALGELMPQIVAAFIRHRMISPPDTSFLLITVIGSVSANSFPRPWPCP